MVPASTPIRSLCACLAGLALATGLASCASNPATGSRDVVLSSQKGEVEQSRRYYDQITRYYGTYEDQGVQDYVNAVGQRVARNSDLPDLEWRFTVIDDGSINAFTTGGGYVYVHRGLLAYLNSEAELAAVIGHEIAHVTARHPAKAQTRSIGANLGLLATIILTGSPALADLGSIGAAAWIQGYGRGAESEADAIGMKYLVRAGYDPRAMGRVFETFKAQESFELAAARDEGREPRIYHGVFSSHPAPDDRAYAAARAAAQVGAEPAAGFAVNRNVFMQAVDGLAFGSSRAQGVVRDNRFYHADMGITLAFPRGWIIENQRDRIVGYTKNQESVLQITMESRPENKAPREFLIEHLKGAQLAGGEAVSINGMEGYSVLTRSGSPLDRGAGPIRFIALYRGRSAFVFAGASRSARDGRPEADGLFRSVAETMRELRAAEYALAEPYRLKIVRATDKTRLADYAQDIPAEKYHKAELELINGVYPNKALPLGEYIKVVE
ncbi:MAG: M48 family metalloprotease [Steroidobacteraceae bacterium]